MCTKIYLQLNTKIKAVFQILLLEHCFVFVGTMYKAKKEKEHRI